MKFDIYVVQNKPISSESFAERINSWGISGTSQVAFVISSDFPQPDERLTLSPMDMEPGLQATILFEQLYRAYLASSLTIPITSSSSYA